MPPRRTAVWGESARAAGNFRGAAGNGHMTCRSIYDPFERVQVRFSVAGGSRVEWSLVRNFLDPLPHSYQLQGAPTAAPDADDWRDIGLPALNAFYLIDDARRVCGKTLEWHYRVVLTTPLAVYTSPAANALSELDFRDWRLAQDMVRKERLRHRLYTSIEGWLLKRKRFGPPCPRCIEPMTGETNDGNCPVCLGTGVLAGYYAAVPDYFVEAGLVSSNEQQDPQQVEGTVKRLGIKGRVLGDPLVNSFDVLIARKSDQRFYVHTVGEAAVIRGYPIVQNVELRMAPFSDVIYNLDLTGS